MAVGCRRWDLESFEQFFDGDGDEHHDCAQMFVTPELDGWTLVFGEPVFESGLAAHDLEIAGGGASPFHAARQQFCVELSRRFGAAQWYSLVQDGGCGDSEGWCLAE